MLLIIGAFAGAIIAAFLVMFWAGVGLLFGLQTPTDNQIWGVFLICVTLTPVAAIALILYAEMRNE